MQDPADSWGMMGLHAWKKRLSKGVRIKEMKKEIRDVVHM